MGRHIRRKSVTRRPVPPAKSLSKTDISAHRQKGPAGGTHGPLERTREALGAENYFGSGMLRASEGRADVKSCPKGWDIFQTTGSAQRRSLASKIGAAITIGSTRQRLLIGARQSLIVRACREISSACPGRALSPAEKGPVGGMSPGLNNARHMAEFPPFRQSCKRRDSAPTPTWSPLDCRDGHSRRDAQLRRLLRGARKKRCRKTKSQKAKTRRVRGLSFRLTQCSSKAPRALEKPIRKAAWQNRKRWFSRQEEGKTIENRGTKTQRRITQLAGWAENTLMSPCPKMQRGSTIVSRVAGLGPTVHQSGLGAKWYRSPRRIRRRCRKLWGKRSPAGPDSWKRILAAGARAKRGERPRTKARMILFPI